MIAARVQRGLMPWDVIEKERVVSHMLQLDDDEAEVVVEALRNYRETWQDGAVKSLTGDLQVSPQQAADVLGRIEAVLERLPERGVTL
jgi:Mg2+ and Co2+ transporter CorA